MKHLTSSWFAAALGAAWIFTHSSVCLAQAGCIPDARGVPALSGPPQWVGPNVPPGTTRPVVDDPRWVGSLRHDMPTQGGALATQATFRALNSGGFLYLTFQALIDPNDPTLGDSVWLGLGDSAAGSTKHLLTFDLDSATGAGPDSITPTYFTKTTGGPGGWTAAGAPAILLDARRWVDTAGSASGRYEWVISLRIDQAGAGLSSAFKLWYAVTVNSGGAPVPTTALYQWPFTAVAPESGQIVMSDASVDPDTWGNATIGTFAAPCIGGISLNPMQIGAAPAPDNEIRTLSSNDFFATPDYGSFTSTAGMLTARFRYANWGSTIADMTNAPWIDIDLPNSGISNTAAGTIGFTCIQSASPPANQGTCPIPSAGSSTHQCMLVELSKTAQPPGVVPNLFFSRDSAFRNMDFVALSRMVDTAEITIRGLPDMAGSPTRDVYLYVKTANMPPLGEKPWKLPSEQMQVARRNATLTATGQGPLPLVSRGDGQPDLDALRKALGASEQNQKPLDELYAKSAHEHLIESYPTYEVHTFYDTGNKIVVKGETHLLIEPMIPYGYFADHAGDLYGFTHSIAGINGAVLTEISPDFYRVHVPNGGSVQVQTTLEAHESPRGQVKPVPPCHCQCGILGAPSTAMSGLLALGAAVSLLGVLAFRRRRRQ